MTFLDKLGIKGKKNKASQPMGDEKKRNLERQVLEARTKLEEYECDRHGTSKYPL